MRHLFTLLCSIFTLVFWLLPTAPQALDAAKGRVVLTVSGELTVTNSGDSAVFDLDMLRALGTQTIETTTIWTDGVQEFTGVPLGNLLEALDIEQGTLRAIAINDYAVTIPVEDAAPGHALIAFARDGKQMSVRDKGPLWIVYPFDSDAQFQSEVYYSRSIWQLNRLEVIP